MNAAESLAREVMRVTELRERYRALDGLPQVMVKPAIMMMDIALEDGCIAAGSNDPIVVLEAITTLKGFEK